MRSINSQLAPRAGLGKVILPPPVQNPVWYTDATKKLADAAAKLTALSQGQGLPSYLTDSLADVKAAQSDLDAALQGVQQAQAQLTTLQNELDTCNLSLATAKGAIGQTGGGTTGGGTTGGTTTPTTGVSGTTAALIGAAGFAAGIVADEGARAVMKRRR